MGSKSKGKKGKQPKASKGSKSGKKGDPDATKPLSYEELVKHSFFKKGVTMCWFGRDKRVLLPVVDQLKCNSCVACVVCLLLAAVYAIEHPEDKVLYDLAIQHMVDSATRKSGAEEDSKLCRTSDFKEAYDYLKDEGVYETTNYGTYKGRRQLVYKEPKVRRLRITNGVFLERKNHEEVCAKLQSRPLSAAVVFTDKFWDFKGESIYVPPEGTDDSATIDSKYHAVMVIGHGTDAETEMDFYIIQSSWGTDFGFYGYAKVVSTCLHYVSYPEGVDWDYEWMKRR